MAERSWNQGEAATAKVMRKASHQLANNSSIRQEHNAYECYEVMTWRIYSVLECHFNIRQSCTTLAGPLNH